MSTVDLSADLPLLTWNEQSVGDLPTGTVTLLLADVEGSTRLWETQSGKREQSAPRTPANLLARPYRRVTRALFWSSSSDSCDAQDPRR